MKKKTKAIRPPPPQYPMVLETFGEPSPYGIRSYLRDKPSCFNLMPNFERYRITIEKVDEPIEVVRERLKKLWSESDNHHNYAALKAAGARIGVDLDHDKFGAWNRFVRSAGDTK